MTSTFSSNDSTAPAVGDKSALPRDTGTSGAPGNNPLLQPFLDQGKHSQTISKKDVDVSGLVLSASERDPDDLRWIARPQGYHSAPEKPKALTPERVESVRKEMEKSVDDLVPDAQKAILKKLRDGAIDGDPAAIQEAYKALKDDPKMLHAMVNELNKEFKRLGSSAALGVTDDNRLLMSADGKNGIVISDSGISPASVTGDYDGHIHLADQQQPSASVAEVAGAVRRDICTEPELFFPTHTSDPIWKNQESNFPRRFRGE